MALTVLQINNAKPKEKAYKLADGQGMYLEISPVGGRVWKLKYRFDGKEKKLTIGPYPEISLNEARERRFNARKQLIDGIDPTQHKKQIKQARMDDAAITLEVVTRQWIEHKKKRVSKRYINFTIGRLEKDILCSLGDRPISSITAKEVISVLQFVEKRAKEVARRLKQTLDEIYRYGIVHELVKQNIMNDIKSDEIFGRYKKEHYACIEPDEIPGFLKALNTNKARLYPLTQLAIRLLMLTFVRTSELIDAKWSEIDWEGKQWIIPAERMKMRRDHIVPLSNQALTILEELRDLSGHREFIFPGLVNPRQSMSNNTILQALAGMGYKGKMTGHGFRALAMTTLKEKLNYEHEIIDRQLAHAPKNKIVAAYDRAKFLPQRKEMMQSWADFIEQSGLK